MATLFYQALSSRGTPSFCSTKAIYLQSLDELLFGISNLVCVIIS